MTLTLAVVGGGHMGAALVSGLVRNGWTGIVVVEQLAEQRARLEARFPSGAVRVAAEVPPVEAGVVAVKPHDVEAACRALAAGGAGRILSVAAGVTAAELRAWAGEGPAVLRAMPNTPALLGAGASGLAAGPGATQADLDWGCRVLGAVGSVEVVEERHLDAVTGLSGSGPAYVFLAAEALVDAGVSNGLPRPVALRLAVQTILGAGRMLAEVGDPPEVLRAGVTSPAGTTAAGLRVLEARAFRSALIEAVTAAAARSAELGGAAPGA